MYYSFESAAGVKWLSRIDYVPRAPVCGLSLRTFVFLENNAEEAYGTNRDQTTAAVRADERITAAPLKSA